jgi:hypothetical protein
MPRGARSSRQNDFFNVCSHCIDRICCFGTRPPITPKRRKIIEAYLKKNGIATADAFAEADYVFPRENPDGYCVFYNVETAKCLIHPVKPETCVAGPITFDINKQSGSVEWYIKKERICPLAGIVFNDKRMLSLRLEIAKRELLTLIDALSPKELEAILKKEEPDTFPIDETTVPRSDRT